MTWSDSSQGITLRLLLHDGDGRGLRVDVFDVSLVDEVPPAARDAVMVFVDGAMLLTQVATGAVAASAGA